ncbi:MAG: lamin tail domain-containing protein [Candidatus Paceibacterota bacterium]|jgi:endonuclease YncB( thermonuclease family)
MENRKFIKIIIPVFLAGIFIIFPSSASAYHTDTHAYLTEEISNFFNRLNPDNKIDNNLLPYLIDGSRKEDGVPRWMNHFYDPVYNRGLETPILGKWQNSKNWAKDDSNQNKLAYKVPATIASVLTAVQQGKISALSTESAFVWNKALKQWIQGEKEESMFTLGHIIHLIEDASVPDHARNDSHVKGSPYEDYASNKKLTGNVDDEDVPNFDNLDEYFYELATYSNNNFYSQDTIGIQSGYQSPEPDSVNMCDDYYCGIRSVDGITYKIFIKEKQGLLNNVVSNKENISLVLNKSGGDKILSDYWSLLSTKSVQYGTGVINLFFEEVEKNKNNPEFTGNNRSFFAQMIDAIGGVWNSIFGSSNFQEVSQVSIDNNNQQDNNQNQDNDNDNQDQSNDNQEDGQNFNTRYDIERSLDIVVNDKNKDDKEQFLVTRVIDGDTIVLENSSIVRYIGIDAPEIAQDPTKSDCYADEAKNRNEELVLNKKVTLENGPQDKDDFGRLLRYAYPIFASSEDLNISVNQTLIEEGYVYSYNFNHPHSLDGQFEAAENRARQSQKGIWSKPCQEENKQKQETVAENKNRENNQTNNSSSFCSYATSQSPSRQGLSINEVAWMGTTNSASDEWIEIKNTSQSEITLFGWQIIGKDDDIKINLSDSPVTKLSPGQLLLLERTDDSSASPSADIIYTGSLANTNDGIRLFNSQCQLIDEIVASPDWLSGNNEEKRTAEKDSSGNGWHTSSVINGTPKQENSSPYSTPPPSGSGQPSQNQNPPENQNQASISGIIITEIMYNPEGTDSDREWIEIHNSNSSPTDITGMYFNENDTNHRIEATQGMLILNPNQYAVIADSPPTFLLDFPNYSGTLIDSSFSLNNTGESLKLRNGESVMDEVLYSSSWGANGNGKSLQKISGQWQENNPTPGSENVVVAALPQQNIVPPDHLVISEIQISGGSGHSDDEFIEIYNPTNNPISLDGYSIQYLSGNATNTENISKKNFRDVHLAQPLSFFLLANGSGSFSAPADMTYSFSLSGASTGASVFLVATTTPIKNYNDENIVDKISYGNVAITTSPTLPTPDDNKSLERKTIKETNCVVPQTSGEFLGNTCDTDKFFDDFILRETPLAQSSQNFPEPRNAPTQPQNFLTSYNNQKILLSASWLASLDFRGSSSNITYQINDADSDSLLATTTANSIEKIIDEVGRDYNLSIKSLDRDLMPSETSLASVSVPSFVLALNFFKNPSDSSQSDIEIVYDQYPFIPNNHDAPNWRMLVFYINSDPPKQPEISDSPGSSWGKWPDENIDKIISTTYKKCAFDPSSDLTLGLADNIDNCKGGGSGIGMFGRAIMYDQIEDKNIILPANYKGNTNFLTSDYITVGFYQFDHSAAWSGGPEVFKLAAIDRTKHYFSNTLPSRQKPIIPPNFVVETIKDGENNYFIPKWDDSTDPDSLDSLITYELNFHKEGDVLDSSKWTTTQRGYQSLADGSLKQIEPKISVSASGNYNFYLRAKDDWNNYSDVATTSGSIEIPAVLAQTIPTISGGYNSVGFKTDATFTNGDQKISQSFTLTNRAKIVSIKTALNSAMEGPAIKARASIQTSVAVGGDFAPSRTEIYSAVLEPILRFSSTNEPGYFIVTPSNLELDAGLYFLVIESQEGGGGNAQYLVSYVYPREGYSEGNHYFQNVPGGVWINSQRDLYIKIEGVER